jgi:predicted Co/Zn/Cd cation transporter (cation efflux family)
MVALTLIAVVEGAVLMGYAVFDAVAAVRVGATGPRDVSNGPAILLQIVLFASFAAGMLWVARGWWTSRRWARAPFLLAQLIILLVGVPLAQSGGSVERYAGIGAALLASVNRALEG